jgi:mono/diheme cytochrome c family protein
MVKSFLLVFAAVLVIFYAVPGQGSMPPQTAGAAKPSTEAQARMKRTYENDCAMCHGSNGDGKTDLAKDMGLTVADFTNPATLGNKSDKELFDIIRNGKDKMPPEDAGRAKDDEVKSLIAYIRSFSKGQPTVPAAPGN